MTEPRTILLGGTSFAVPALPLRITRAAYPLCRKLTQAGLIERCKAADGVLDCSIEEMDDLAEIAFLGASAADKALIREIFEDMPIAPYELLDAFFAIRLQTGAWVEMDPQAGLTEPGEAPGA